MLSDALSHLAIWIGAVACGLPSLLSHCAIVMAQFMELSGWGPLEMAKSTHGGMFLDVLMDVHHVQTALI
jgi:hypothetical protein